MDITKDATESSPKHLLNFIELKPNIFQSQVLMKALRISGLQIMHALKTSNPRQGISPPLSAGAEGVGMVPAPNCLLWFPKLQYDFKVS